MKNEKFIFALKECVQALRNDTTHYDWNEHECCNVGIVAQALLNRKPEHIADDWVGIKAELCDIAERKKIRINQTWEGAIKWVCPVSGITGIDIIDALLDAGMTREDIIHLEFLNDPDILKRSGINTARTWSVQSLLSPKYYHEDKENLIKYLSAWTDILEEKID